jgi:flagellar basal body-associated protein FliL
MIALVVATLLGAGGGGFVGLTIVGEPGPANAPAAEASHEPAPPKKTEAADKSHGGHGAPEATGKEAPGSKMKLKELAPIVTNLAAPETGWVRLQAAIVYESQDALQLDVLVSEVTADIVAFLRTMTLASIEGSDGLRRLSEDLSERAQIRSEGRIHELIIQALVVQ